MQGLKLNEKDARAARKSYDNREIKTRAYRKRQTSFCTTWPRSLTIKKRKNYLSFSFNFCRVHTKTISFIRKSYFEQFYLIIFQFEKLSNWILRLPWEIKSHVYGKWQLSDSSSYSSWEFLKIENMQLNTIHKNCYSQNWREATNFCVEIMNSKAAQVKGKLGHVVHVCRLP